MEPTRAHEIIEALSEGIDPITGEELIGDGPLHHAEVVRALFEALNALQRRIAVLKRKSSQPSNMGRTWSRDEEEQLRERYLKRDPIAEIARAHGRTSGAVVARLVHIGCVNLERLSEIPAS